MTTSRSSPTNPFPLLPLRNGVLFPGTVITLPVGREQSIALVRGLSKGDVLGVATQKDPAVEVPGADDLYPIGTSVRVVDLARLPNGDYRIALEALGRFSLRGLVRTDPYWIAEGDPARRDRPTTAPTLASSPAPWPSTSASSPTATPPSARRPTRRRTPASSPTAWPPRWACPPTRRSPCSSALDVVERLRLVAGLVIEAKALSDVKRKIDQDVRRELGKDQRDAILREQLRAIKKELGEDTPRRRRGRAARAARQGRPLRRGARGRRSRAEAPGVDLPAAGRAPRGAHLPGVDRRPALERPRRGQGRSRGRRRRSSTRTTPASTT